MNPAQMAAKLYDARDAARSLLGPNFAPTMKEWGDVVQCIAAAKEIELIPACTLAAGQALKDHKPYVAMLVMAATVELIEPTPVPA